MELQKSTLFMKNFSFLICIFYVLNGFSCGWSEDAETTRLALFKAERANFLKLRYFNYSGSIYASSNEISVRDQRQNCYEWRTKLGNSVNENDIFTILYKTDSEVFETAFLSKTMTQAFKDNTFIAFLLQPKNKVFLNYVLTAKRLEFNGDLTNNSENRFEGWDSIETNYYDNQQPKPFADYENLDDLILKTKDPFLKQRYAFLNLRNSFYTNEKQKVIDLYSTYFEKNKNSILAPWAMYYMALCLNDEVLSNYYLSQVFLNCDDKSLAVYQHFNFDFLNETLLLAKNNDEKSAIYVLNSIHNPSPQLTQLKQICELNPNSSYFSFLISREINKLEDWIFTPKYTNLAPTVLASTNNWYNDYEKARQENLVKDSAYLKELKVFLISQMPNFIDDQKEFMATAIAQLCFIDDDVESGKSFVNQISSNANASVLMQKNIQLALISLKQNDIMSNETKQNLYTNFQVIENLVESDTDLLKSLYSLFRIASKEYFNKKDIATAGLLFYKSDNKKNTYNRDYFYNYIGFFERYGVINDIDNLIKMVGNDTKSPFENYICSGTTTSDINVYKEVKGTLAFRNDDLELAQKTFAEMPKDFWDKNYEFKNYLNENPFFPKVIDYNGKRNFNYNFNKATFVSSILRLKKSKTASDLIKLGHAYFNVSRDGNAWMMNHYGQVGDYSYNNYVYGAYQNDISLNTKGNYYTCEIAKFYYQKALKVAVNKEQKAMASLMIFECEYHNFLNLPYNENQKFVHGKEIYDFNSKYVTTKVYRDYNCPLLEQFIN